MKLRCGETVDRYHPSIFGANTRHWPAYTLFISRNPPFVGFGVWCVCVEDEDVADTYVYSLNVQQAGGACRQTS
eukprot:scaffold967_cov148-Skeletonema_menzelii.AAC.13